MQELKRALAELRRLGLHLDPEEAAEARTRRRVRLNTRIYPLYRAVGFQLLIAAVVIHNLAVFGNPGGWPMLAFALASEAYCLVSWLALRRWFEWFGRVGGWDLSDLMFVADLALWAGAIHVTGGPQSLIFFLPLLRVADHRSAHNAMTFAHIAPLAYLAVVLVAAMGGGVVWAVEAAKLALLYLAGVYVAWTGRHEQRLREEREAALAAATGFVAHIRERTDRLADANVRRSNLLDRLGSDLRDPLVRMVGFSRYLLEQRLADEPVRGFLGRIRDEGNAALDQLEDAMRPDAGTGAAPRVSVSRLLRRAATGEAEGTDEEPREPAHVIAPDGEVEMRGDGDRLMTLFGHLLAAGRHLNGGTPTVELELVSETGMPHRVVLRTARALPQGSAAQLFDPFAGEMADDPAERVARLELSMARFLADRLGYRLEAETDAPGVSFTLFLH